MTKSFSCGNVVVTPSVFMVEIPRTVVFNKYPESNKRVYRNVSEDAVMQPLAQSHVPVIRMNVEASDFGRGGAHALVATRAACAKTYDVTADLHYPCLLSVQLG